jgi:hypothetical protein
MGGARRTGVPKEIYDSLSLMCPDEKSVSRAPIQSPT